MGHTHHGKGEPKIFARTNEIIRGLNEKEGKDETNLGRESNLEDSLERDDLGQEIDVVGIGQDGGEFFRIQKNEDREAMEEQSSSFGNTFSGSEDEVRSSSDAEADSQFANTPTSQFGQAQFAPEENRTQFVSGEFGRICKKRKVTAHWRKFISPLMWRCHWLELQMNELRSQALLYDKELAKYEGEKQLQSKMIELDYSVSRSVPISCQRHRKRAMERVKRKRIEDTTNISSYMSNHSLFSYYENKKRPETDCQSIDNVCDDRVDEVKKCNGEYKSSLLGLKDGDDFLEEIIFNLDGVQSRVLSLKPQLSLVMSRIAQIEPRVSYARSLSFSPGNNGDMPSDDTLELKVPGTAVSNYANATDYKDEAEEEIENLEKVTHGTVKFQEVKEETKSCSEDAKPTGKPSIEEPGPEEENGYVPVLRPCYTGKKRGRKPKKKHRGGSVSGLVSKRVQKRQHN